MTHINAQNAEKKAVNKPNISFIASFEEVVLDFPKRHQDIVKARFGLFGKEAKTLEEIGREHQITRERVRQIVNEFFKKIKEKKSTATFAQVLEIVEFTLGENSGIMDEERLLEALAGGNQLERNAILFFLECLDEIGKLEGDEFKKSYAHRNFNIDEWKNVKNRIREILEEEQRIHSHDELKRKHEEKFGLIEIAKLEHYLSVSSEISKNEFGKIGLSHWGEINPKVTWQRAYLVLEEVGEPLHFREIAKLIDKYKLGKRKAHPQTVHNELIKDSKFVLVGRGVYALAKWGYKKGTVKDVLEDILKKSGRPLGKNEILEKILKIRQVKKSTILINLNNFFLKVEGDKYSVKK